MIRTIARHTEARPVLIPNGQTAPGNVSRVDAEIDKCEDGDRKDQARNMNVDRNVPSA